MWKKYGQLIITPSIVLLQCNYLTHPRWRTLLKRYGRIPKPGEDSEGVCKFQVEQAKSVHTTQLSYFPTADTFRFKLFYVEIPSLWKLILQPLRELPLKIQHKYYIHCAEAYSEYPSILQTTAASRLPHWSSQIVPHLSPFFTSTRPSYIELPPTSLTVMLRFVPATKKAIS